MDILNLKQVSFHYCFFNIIENVNHHNFWMAVLGSLFMYICSKSTSAFAHRLHMHLLNDWYN